VIGIAADRTVPALLARGAAALEAAGIGTARPEAEWLLAGLLGVDRFTLYLDPARRLSTPTITRFLGQIERRAAREPLQYLLGWEDFHGLRLAVSSDVLVPRPETEGLVEWALEILADRPEPVVADLGTGSGAIACAIAHARPAAEVLAVELSGGALAVASRNVRELGLGARVRLLAGDLFAPLGSIPASLDLVVANPPYLPPAVLKPAGWLLMEIGEDQAGPLASLMAAEGFSGIRARRDLNGIERYIGGRWEQAATTLAGCASGAARREGC